jgi:hypothetical protein
MQKEYLGNKDLERGNLIWEDGIQDSNVVWRYTHRTESFYKSSCHPPTHYRKKKKSKTIFEDFLIHPQWSY